MKKIHRFILPTDLGHQLRDVLKMERGEEINLLDGQGVEGRAKIVATSPSVEVELESVGRNQNEPTRRVILYAAILKREHFELIVQKATEVGVTEVVPVISKRTVKTGIKLDRLRKIATEAAEQSGRGVVPIIHEPMGFEQALLDAKRNETNLFFHTSTTPNPSLKRMGGESMGIFIGPEGGWDESEVEAAKAAGCELATLGNLTLRGETAAIVATYLVATGRL
ncbi:MAG: RsmE family RNA methyltransferase [Patescibacteria group bacterium]